LSVIILTALGGLVWLGYHSIQIRSKGMEGTRLGEFAAVAEQIRQDVKRKLDEFMQREQSRPYTDYQYYYVAENVAPGQQQLPILRSPLADRLYNDLAYGNFQIEPDGKIVTPYYREEQFLSGQRDKFSNEVKLHRDNIEQNLLPVLVSTSGTFKLPSTAATSRSLALRNAQPKQASEMRDLAVSSEEQARLDYTLKSDMDEKKISGKQTVKGKMGLAKEYAIESLKQDSQKTQVLVQPRSVVTSNTAQSAISARQQQRAARIAKQDEAEYEETAQIDALQQTAESQPSDEIQQYREAGVVTSQLQEWQSQDAAGPYEGQSLDLEQMPQQSQSETVQIQIEPFVPLVVPEGDIEQSIFGGQVFLLRHVQIENKHLLQGFQLNEKKLIEEVKESAERAVSTRERMSFELPQIKNRQAKEATTKIREVAYTAILDFGFGDLVLNLIETDPAWISKRINWLRNWYFVIITVVLLAVMLSLASLWRNARAQLKLAQKKDDFISAVSHELRTPLTSIRMYSEMLEKDWVKTEDKRSEYYRSMRQESERLSRLIENVLDFSRIQRGRKKYTFSVGDINKCISEVVEMMRPYAAQNGFSINKEFGQLRQTAFDKDAVTQIVVNLLDNAVKYARSAKDKTITVRTKSDNQFILIEVEDHGPGVPHLQRKKIFEEFYRVGAETTRETTGTGLGLALVKKYAQAHNGFVEIITTKPSGAIFRVAIATRI